VSYKTIGQFFIILNRDNHGIYLMLVVEGVKGKEHSFLQPTLMRTDATWDDRFRSRRQKDTLSALCKVECKQVEMTKRRSWCTRSLCGQCLALSRCTNIH
jgi:hypothetical protein